MIKEKTVALRDLISQFFAPSPKEVDGVFNRSAFYYRDRLMRNLMGRFEITNFPDTWDFDYFMSNLLEDGYIGILDCEMGVQPLICGYYGQNFRYLPTNIRVNNPVLGSLERTIDVDCVLMKIQWNYQGISDMLDRYSYLLAASDSSLAVNLMNSKVAFIGEAETEAQAKSLKKMYDEIAAGNPAVFKKANNGTSWQLFNVKNVFVGDLIQNVHRTILNDFLSEIGIRNFNQDKRERLNSAEVTANNDEVQNNVSHWLKNINEGLKKVHTMWPDRIPEMQCRLEQYGADLDGNRDANGDAGGEDDDKLQSE